MCAALGPASDKLDVSSSNPIVFNPRTPRNLRTSFLRGFRRGRRSCLIERGLPLAAILASNRDLFARRRTTRLFHDAATVEPRAGPERCVIQLGVAGQTVSIHVRIKMPGYQIQGERVNRGNWTVCFFSYKRRQIISINHCRSKHSILRRIV